MGVSLNWALGGVVVWTGSLLDFAATFPPQSEQLLRRLGASATATDRATTEYRWIQKRGMAKAGEADEQSNHGWTRIDTDAEDRWEGLRVEG